MIDNVLETWKLILHSLCRIYNTWYITSTLYICIGCVGALLNAFAFVTLVTWIAKGKLSWKRYLLFANLALSDVIASVLAIASSLSFNHRAGHIRGLPVCINSAHDGATVYDIAQAVGASKAYLSIAAQDNTVKSLEFGEYVMVILAPTLSYIIIILVQNVAVRKPHLYTTLTYQVFIYFLVSYWLFVLVFVNLGILARHQLKSVGDRLESAFIYWELILRLAIQGTLIVLLLSLVCQTVWAVVKRKFPLEVTLRAFLGHLTWNYILFGASLFFFVGRDVYMFTKSNVEPPGEQNSVGYYRKRVEIEEIQAIVKSVWIFRLILDPLVYMFGDRLIRKLLRKCQCPKKRQTSSFKRSESSKSRNIASESEIDIFPHIPSRYAVLGLETTV